jgi:hypothetical protein
MPGKANQRTDVPAADQQPYDLHRLVRALEHAFSKVGAQQGVGAARAFSGNAQIAVDTFSGIVAGLQLDLNPRELVISAQPLSPTEVELTWTDPPNNAGEYIVERSEGSEGHHFEVIARLSTLARSYRDANLPDGTYFRYRVVAINARGRAYSNIIDVGTEIVPYGAVETGHV